jgi:nucleotide-binding universal stress UspA family protein
MVTQQRAPGPAMLLATDLSSRCDRAFERACAIAGPLGATLHIVTAVEGDFREPSWRSSERGALAKVRADVVEALGDRGLVWEPAVAVGAPHEVIIDAASRVNAELIIVGVARNELLGRLYPGRTVEALIRKAPAPVLIVRRRALHSYRQILAPTDYSPAAELALVRAAAIFPEAQFTLLHGYRVPFAGFISEDMHHQEFKESALKEQAEFIARLETSIGQAGRVAGLVEFGEPDQLIVDYVGCNAPDLMVLGAHDHSGLLRALCVDVAGRLLMTAGCDVLVVPEAGERRRGAPPQGRG